MISLASEMTDRKGRHARGWLFYDAECEFCTRFARWLARPLHRRGLATAPLQDPRVAALLGLDAQELLRAIRLVMSDGRQYTGAEALVALGGQFAWARPLVWMSKLPGGPAALRSAYDWMARRRRCRALPEQFCVSHTLAGGSRP
jgi:predicted DCC family thiol-disulfide oxidoreductase YuxK